MGKPLWNKSKTKSGKMKYIKLTFGVIILFSVGFLRDFVFIKLNNKLGTPMGTLPFSLYAFDNPYYILKWVLTQAFCDVYLLIACFIIYTIYKNKKYVKITIAFYVSFMAISLISLGIGHLLNNDAMGYRFARDLMGLVQSPALVMIMIPAFKLFK